MQYGELEKRTAVAEEEISDLENTVSTLQATVADLVNQVRVMGEAQDDLENRNRRRNLRVFGVPEGTEGTDAVKYMQAWIPKYLTLKTKGGTVKIERAHRTLAPKPAPNQRPRAIVLQLHNFRDKQRIMDTARGHAMKQTTLERPKISFYNDYSAAVIKRHKKFDGVKSRLRAKKAEYALLYPATLRVKIDGAVRRFTSPDQASAYVDSLEATGAT